MVREHGSLTKDAETNEAAWEAARGAAYGSVKVCVHVLLRLRLRLVFFVPATKGDGPSFM